ncbi:protocatechuate 3,4-dioxygenase beta subunit [Sphingobium xanthum]|uniref:dioxygenase family protein n=1 Tax=Sphingobium xanthum TaxID=1387165 RepID=UPI001C8C9FFF|nr:intradiol ring-cleavage dioxygenase [Sphingobium xanthum]
MAPTEPRSSHAESPHHGDDLSEDLMRLGALLGRRKAIGWLSGAATFALLGGCGSDSGGGGNVVVAPTPSPSPSPTLTPTPVPSPTATATPTPVCIATPSETRGPYPADGTNATSGSTNNVLTASGVVRSDIRSSFIGSTTVAGGVQLTLTITLNAINSCTPLAGYAIYIWHANALGRYSLYDVPAETYLRGVQVTDSNGRVTFTTIVPGCYAGRFPHINVQVFGSLALANSGTNARLVSQLIVPTAVCTAVYADTTTYAGSQANFGAVSVANDNVFGDNTAAENAGRTLDATGSVSAGYTATVTLTVNPSGTP